jgi:hypothetical protein
MAGHSESKSDKSYSDDVEFEAESEILLVLYNVGMRFRGHGEGTFVCPLCHGKKMPSWSLLELLQHVIGKSRRGEGIFGPEHSALAKYILNNNVMAHDHELGGVGDCSGNEAVKAHRYQCQAANRADREARKEKVLKKYLCVMMFFVINLL